MSVFRMLFSIVDLPQPYVTHAIDCKQCDTLIFASCARHTSKQPESARVSRFSQSQPESAGVSRSQPVQLESAGVLRSQPESAGVSRSAGVSPARVSRFSRSQPVQPESAGVSRSEPESAATFFNPPSRHPASNYVFQIC